MRNRSFFVSFAAVGLLALAARPASAVILKQHVGSNDPTTEGWQLSTFGSGHTFGPINDGGTPAWQFQSGSGNFHYQFQLTVAEDNAATANNYYLENKFRIGTPGVGGNGRDVQFSFNPFVDAGLNSKLLVLRVNENPSGLAPGSMELEAHPGLHPAQPTYTIPGGTAANDIYHTYRIDWDNATSTAAVSVDGLPAFNLLAVDSTGSVAEMVGEDWDTQINWAGYELGYIPEPTSLALLGLGALTLIRRARGR